MGNSNSDPITDAAEAFKDNKNDFQIGKPCRSPFGHAIEWKHKKTGQSFLVKGKIVDEDPVDAQARVRFLLKKKENCIPLEGISKLESSQGWCAAILYELRIAKLGPSIYDLLKSNFDFNERILWRLIVGITKVR